MNILGWFSNRKRNDLRVVLYTRHGCCLCDDAWAALRSFQSRHGFELTSKDIDADPDLRNQFDVCVPVVEVDGQVRMRGRFNPVLFQRLLDAR